MFSSIDNCYECDCACSYCQTYQISAARDSLSLEKPTFEMGNLFRLKLNCFAYLSSIETDFASGTYLANYSNALPKNEAFSGQFIIFYSLEIPFANSTAQICEQFDFIV